MKVIFLWMIICTVWGICLYVVERFDEPDWVVKKKEYIRWISISLANAFLIRSLQRSAGESVELAVLAGCLIFACMTDCKSCQVYRFVWWIGCGCGALCLRGQVMELAELVLFCLLQELFFCRFYGRADCHAFGVCAMIEFGMGMGMKECVIHMLLAFTGLAVVQLLRNNINSNGNLKRPVAFIPYITVSFWLNCYCFC